jgi:hypothetical protein
MRIMESSKSSKSISLVGPCGMNCGVCYAYLRVKNKCLGCRVPDPHKAVTCKECKIKNCYKFRFGMAKFCFECEKMPCDKITHIDTRYRTKYHMSMIENLNYLKEHGVESFLKNEKRRWTCPACGGTFCVHKHCCYSCGAELQEEPKNTSNPRNGSINNDSHKG